MATRKVLFVLSLALLINPTLHCMDNIENEDTENSNKVIVALAIGWLSFAAAKGITNKFLIEPKKQKLLHESQNVEVFTSKKFTEPYNMIEETGIRLGIYGIFNTNNFSLTCTKSEYNNLFNSSGTHSRILKIFYGRLINKLLPRWFELLRGKDKYNLDDDKKITKAVRSCMQTMAINGSVVLMTPPNTQSQSKSLLGGIERKTLVVHSNNSDCQVFSFSTKKYKTYSSLEKIEAGTFRYTDTDLSGHIILATKNILQQDLEKALKNDSVFSNDLGEFIPRTSDVRKKVKEYQQNIINQVFPENDGGGSKEGKAILMIPLQNSYYELKH